MRLRAADVISLRRPRREAMEGEGTGEREERGTGEREGEDGERWRVRNGGEE